MENTFGKCVEGFHPHEMMGGFANKCERVVFLSLRKGELSDSVKEIITRAETFLRINGLFFNKYSNSNAYAKYAGAIVKLSLLKDKGGVGDETLISFAERYLNGLDILLKEDPNYQFARN